MPCNEIRRYSLAAEFNDLDALVAGLKAAGYMAVRQGTTVTFSQDYLGGSYANGKLILSRGMDANEIKRAYSTQIVKTASARFGWTVKETAPNTLKATRRY